jgi:beta-glucanase (GH16 family)
MWYDEDCVCVSTDTTRAYLIAENKPKEIRHWDGKTYNPTVACGLLRSVDTFGYGRFSAEIQLPKGKNIWPAFWLVGEGEPWPACGEIDIMEGWTNRFGGYFKMGIPQPPYLVPSWNTTTNIHWQEDDGRHGYTGSRRLPLLFSLKRPAHNFVKYEVEWRQDIITFRVNGKRVRTYGYDVAKHLHDKKMHIIFDLWTTGEDFTCETPMKIRDFEYKPIETL